MGAATPPRAHPRRPHRQPRPAAAGAASGGAIVPAAGGSAEGGGRGPAGAGGGGRPRGSAGVSPADGVAALCEEPEPPRGEGDLSKVTYEAMDRTRIGTQVLPPAMRSLEMGANG